MGRAAVAIYLVRYRALPRLEQFVSVLSPYGWVTLREPSKPGPVRNGGQNKR